MGRGVLMLSEILLKNYIEQFAFQLSQIAKIKDLDTGSIELIEDYLSLGSSWMGTDGKKLGEKRIYTLMFSSRRGRLIEACVVLFKRNGLLWEEASDLNPWRLQISRDTPFIPRSPISSGRGERRRGRVVWDEGYGRDSSLFNNGGNLPSHHPLLNVSFRVSCVEVVQRSSRQLDVNTARQIYPVKREAGSS